MDPKRLTIKVVVQLGCNNWPGRPHSHHSGSLSNVVKLIILCAFVRIVGYFDAQIREISTVQVGGLTYLLAFLKKNITNHLHGINYKNNLHSSSSSRLHL